MGNARLYNIGVRLVKFAWMIEIIAVTIGFLISILVSYSAYKSINQMEGELGFGDYASMFVAGLPFVLVAVVEATKIPMATAFMYARHFRWKILFFIGIVMLVTITFETMINGFERNFSNLTFAINERKNDALLLQNKIDDLNEKIKSIDVIDRKKVEKEYAKKISKVTNNFNKQVQQQKQYIEYKLSNMENISKEKVNAELEKLYAKETQIYAAWDKEREEMQNRLRTLLNNNMENASNDKKKLEKELALLKNEMKRALRDANFLTRPSVEKKYRKLIEQKEKRLYQVSDFSSGSKALDQQTGTEAQLQKQLQVIGENYQKRIDAVRERIDHLNNQLKKQQLANEYLQKKYREDLASFTASAAANRKAMIRKMEREKKKRLSSYSSIQSEIKILRSKIFELKKQQTQLAFEMNKMVNQNQVYRIAAYISDKENGLDVPKSIVGMVALIWFASLAFISAVTGVFLAIAGIYIQKCYDPAFESNQ